jgi:hypothetical protein
MDENEFIENYYRWVVDQAFEGAPYKRMYDGVLRMMFNTPFYWTIMGDSNRAGDASVFRHYERGQVRGRKHGLNTDWLDMWENSAPSVLEVLVGICERWHQFYEFQTQWYFWQLFHNLGLNVFSSGGTTEWHETKIRQILDRWMSRQFGPNGEGSPFPVPPNKYGIDMRITDIWGQMNVYAREHFE